MNGRKGAMLIMESEKTIVGRPPAQTFSLYFIIIVCICRSRVFWALPHLAF